jgi:hypothetical protein
VEVQVQVPLQAEVPTDPVLAPGRPVVGREHHVGAVGVQVDRLGDVARPLVGVTDDRTAQREQVVQGVGRVLGHAQGADSREQDVHLRRGLGARGDLELHADPVDHARLAGRGDEVGRPDQGDGAARRGLSQPCPDLALGPAGQGRAVHVARASGHRGPGVDVLLDRVLEEPVRRDDDAAPGIHVRLGRHALDPAEVVDVAVGVDDADDRPVATVLAVERQGRRRGLGTDQGVDDEHPRRPLDEADVRQVEPADLVDARHHLEQAVHRDELRLAPQARVHRVGGVALQEPVGVVVPDHAAVRGADDARVQATKQPAPGVVEVGGVVEREGAQQGGVGGSDGPRGKVCHGAGLLLAGVCRVSRCVLGISPQV